MAANTKSVDVLRCWDFSAESADKAVLDSGWSDCSADAVWAVGGASILRLPVVANGAMQLELTLMPFVRHPARPSQCLGVEVNGTQVGFDRLSCRTVIGFHLPRRLVASSPELVVRLHCPDAISPAEAAGEGDTRRLAFAVWGVRILSVPAEIPFEPIQVSGDLGSGGVLPDDQIRRIEATFQRPVADIVTQFESLGTNCEFGIFQRRCGSDPLGLLRFAGLPYPHLLDALDAGFAGIGEPAQLSATVEGVVPEWMVRQSTYELSFHTFQPPSAISASELLARQSRILTFRRDRLMELLSTGEKLFVVMRPEGLTAAEALPLLARLRARGPSALLFAANNTGVPAGSVTMLGPGFYRGSLDGIGLGPREAWLPDDVFGAWLSICALAFWLWTHPPAKGSS